MFLQQKEGAGLSGLCEVMRLWKKGERPAYLKLIWGTERREGAATSRPGLSSACIQDTNDICHPNV